MGLLQSTATRLACCPACRVYTAWLIRLPSRADQPGHSDEEVEKEPETAKGISDNVMILPFVVIVSAKRVRLVMERPIP